MWSIDAIRIDSDYCRAGVIPFCFKNNVLWFCFGVDKRTGELTDFGGGTKKWETPLEGAARELFEESSGLFNEYSNRPELNPLNSTICISRNEMTLIFMPVSNSYMNIKKNNISDEIESIVWLTRRDVMDLLKYYSPGEKNIEYKYKMWKKIAYFIIKNLKEFIVITDKLDEFYWFK